MRMEHRQSLNSALVVVESSERVPLLRVQQDVRPLLAHELHGALRRPAVAVHQVAADQGGAAGSSGLAVDVDRGLGVAGDNLFDETDTSENCSGYH